MTDLTELKRNTNIINVLTGYGVELIQRGHQYSCKCIWHDDNNPSMSVFEGDDGIWRVHCHSACGKTGTIIDVIKEFECCDEGEAIKRLEANHFVRNDHRIIPEKPIKPNAWTSMEPLESYDSFDLPNMKIQQTWCYRDSRGVPMGYVVRYLKPDGSKDYRPWTYGRMSANVEPSWRCKVWSPVRPLYGLDRLAERPNAKVCIVEGEKAADAAQVLLPGMVCITWPGGSNAVKKVDWHPLANRNILLVPDADAAGEQAMYGVAAHLMAIGCTVRYLDTSCRPQGWDLADAVSEGWTRDDIVTFAEERVSLLTSRELEKHKLEQEKKTVQNAPIEGEYVPVLDPTILPPPAEQLPPNVTKIKPHTAITQDYLPPEFSELSMARHWSNHDGKDWCYVVAWGKWVKWDGARWCIDEINGITNIIGEEMTRATYWLEAKSLSETARKALCTKRNIANVRDLAACIPAHATLPAQWDANPWLMGTPEGTLDLKTGKVRAPERSDMITRQAAVSPKRGKHPQWDKVLDRCTRGDKEMRDYYQRWCGYILTGDCREEGFLFIHGAGNSGKSKFIDCIGDILGKADEGGYCATAKIEMLMESKHERHTEEMACLAGARMVRTSEPDEGARWNEALLKLITGRDTVSARRLYEKQFTFKPEFKLMINGNFKPAFKNTGEEIRRRMHFVEFPDSIPEADRIQNLPELLREEWPAIMQWMIDGCLEWQRIGLSKPQQVKDATHAYLAEEDTMGRWIEEQCTVGASLKVQSGEAYRSYKAFVESHGEGVVSQKRFSQRMEARGYGKAKGGSGARYILGLDIVPAPASGWNAPDEF